MEAYLLSFRQRRRGWRPVAHPPGGAVHPRVDSKVGRGDRRARRDAACGFDRARGARVNRRQPRVVNARLAYAAFEDVFGATRFKSPPRRARTCSPLGVHEHEEPLPPRRAVRRGADRADTVNTIPPDARRVQRPRRGRDAHPATPWTRRALFGKRIAPCVPVESPYRPVEGVTGVRESYDDPLGAIETRRREGALEERN